MIETSLFSGGASAASRFRCHTGGVEREFPQPCPDLRVARGERSALQYLGLVSVHADADHESLHLLPVRQGRAPLHHVNQVSHRIDRTATQPPREEKSINVKCLLTVGGAWFNVKQQQHAVAR